MPFDIKRFEALLLADPFWLSVLEQAKDLMDGDIDDPKTAVMLRDAKQKVIDLAMAELKKASLVVWFLWGDKLSRQIDAAIEKEIQRLIDAAGNPATPVL